MSFWGGLKKGLVKVGKYAAPVAAGMFGGPAAAMAVSAGMNALDKKMSGGSWKQALGSAAIGAGTSYLGGKIPGIDKIAGKGLSPTGKGLMSNLGAIGKQTGKNMLVGNTKGFVSPGDSGANQGALSGFLNNLSQSFGDQGPSIDRGGMNSPYAMNLMGDQTGEIPPPDFSRMPPQQPRYAVPRRNTNFPDLARSISAGRRAANPAFVDY